MRKYLYAFLCFCLFGGAFAEQPSGVYQSQHVSGILIPRAVLVQVIIEDDVLSQAPGAYENMLAKYDELAGPFGQEKLTVDNMTQICVASGIITQASDCFARVFNPALTKMGRVRFFDVCSEQITGGTNYCVDDVFKIKRSGEGNPYHQDVNVSEYQAVGFAIEYAKKQGHDVWCSSEIQDGIIKCSTLDNNAFYTFKFAGTQNTSESALIPSFGSVGNNLIHGVCALFSAEYNLGLYWPECKMDCRPGTPANSVIPRFGLTIHPTSTENKCMINIPELGPNEVKRYPGYEYMTDAFRSIQTVLNIDLINVLKAYVALQRIDVQSFDCNYSPFTYHDEISSGVWAGMPTSADDLLRCRLNGTEVDFIFDDLYESKGYEQRAGKAALQCVAVGGHIGTGRTCQHLTQQQCAEANAVVPGGTRWDDSAEVCILRDASKARMISNAIQITGGVVLAVGITVASGGSATLAIVAGVASVAVDAAFVGYEQLLILEPSHRARQFAEDVAKCGIPFGTTYPSCSQEQVNCASRVVNEHFARLDEILVDLNPEQYEAVTVGMENVSNCLPDDLWDAATKTSTPNVWDKTLDAGGGILLAASIFITPENMINRLANSGPRMYRILSRAKMVERASSSLNGARYVRIYVDNLDMNDIDHLVDGIQRNGFHVSSNIEQKTNKQFIGLSDRDIFRSWDNSPNNWLFQVRGGAQTSNRLRIINDGASRFTGNVGRHRVYLEALPTANGTMSPLIRHDGRVIALVNVDGHKIPFYVSSGQAGKDAMGIASGKWYPIAGIGENTGPAGAATGWFNKMPDMNRNPAAGLDGISARLNQIFDGPTYKALGFTDEIPAAASNFRSYINQEFPFGVVPYLEKTPNGHYTMPSKYQDLYNSNIQHITNIFR